MFINLYYLITTYIKGDTMTELVKIKSKRKLKDGSTEEVEEEFEMGTPKTSMEHGFETMKIVLSEAPEGFEQMEEGIYARLYLRPATIINEKTGEKKLINVIVGSKSSNIGISPAEKLVKIKEKLSKLYAKKKSFETEEKEYDLLKSQSKEALEIMKRTNRLSALESKFGSLNLRLNELETKKKELEKQMNK